MEEQKSQSILRDLTVVGPVTSSEKYAAAVSTQTLGLAKLAVALLLGTLLSQLVLKILEIIVPDDKSVYSVALLAVLVGLLSVIAVNIFAVDSVSKAKRKLVDGSGDDDDDDETLGT